MKEAGSGKAGGSYAEVKVAAGIGMPAYQVVLYLVKTEGSCESNVTWVIGFMSQTYALMVISADGLAVILAVIVPGYSPAR